MRKRNGISVELTPLLDVILIILFLIITENGAKSEEVKANAEKEISEYAEEINVLNNTLYEKEREISEKSKMIDEQKNIISGSADFSEISKIISVSVGKNYDRDGGRIIYVADGKNTERILFDWESMRYAENSLSHILSEIIGSADKAPVFISYSCDREETYQRDYELISGVLSEINEEHVFVSVTDK